MKTKDYKGIIHSIILIQASSTISLPNDDSNLVISQESNKDHMFRKRKLQLGGNMHLNYA
jgi:hypothetical protein